MRLDAIESINILDLLSSLTGLKLGNLNTFINSQISFPDSIVSREAVLNVIKSLDESQDDLQDTDEEEEHGSESFMQDSNPESYDGDKLKRW